MHDIDKNIGNVDNKDTYFLSQGVTDMIKYFFKAFALLLLLISTTGNVNAMDQNNTLIMETTKGIVTIELKPELAPEHVERIKTLTSEGFYDGVVFHRVIDGFMAQTGDPTGTGMGGSDYPDLKAEFSKTPYLRGTVGMARSANPDSANSQFFITFGPASFLNGQYTVFGQVVDGMDAIDAINRGEPPAEPDQIVKMTLSNSDKNTDEQAVGE